MAELTKPVTFGGELAEPTPAPNLDDTLAAGFRKENTISSAINWATQPDVGPVDDTHDPVVTLGEGSTYVQDYGHLFVESRNEKDTLRIKAQIDQEIEDERTLLNAGGIGIAASMAAGLIDPVNLLPGGSIYRSVKGGVSVLKSAGSAAAAGVGAAAVSESILQSTQETRGLDETAMNIGASALFAGALGGGAAQLLKGSPEELIGRIARDMEVPLEGQPDAFSPGSLGAAGTKGSNEVDSLGVADYVPGLTNLSPVVRLQLSPSTKARQVVEKLADPVLSMKKSGRGEAVGVVDDVVGSVETRKQFYEYNLVQAFEDMDQQFLQYRFGGATPRFGKARAEIASMTGQSSGQMNFMEFKAAVSKAMRNGDVDPNGNPHVTSAAQSMRKNVFDPLKNEAEGLGLLPEDLDPLTAPSYLSRIYDRTRITADANGEQRFKKIIAQWLRDERGKAQVDPELQDTIRADRTDAEIDSLADEIIDRIISTPDGRLPYDSHLEESGAATVQKKRGGKAPALHSRVFMIPDALIEDFLINDIDQIARTYTRTMAGDVEMQRHFGSLTLQKEIKEVTEEMNLLIGKGKATKKDLDIAIEAISGIRDRMLGTYQVPADPDAFALRAGRVVRTVNYLRLLGGMTVSAIPDMARSVMVQGLGNTWRHGWKPLITSFKGMRASMADMKSLNAGLDMVLDSRAMSMAEITDDFGQHSKFERAIHNSSRNFGVVSLMAPWNAAMKQMSAAVTTGRIMGAAEKLAKGQKVSGKDLKGLAEIGIDKAMAKRILKQFNKYGEKQGDAYLPKALNWDDKGAKDAIRAAVIKESNRVIVTPGQEMPLFMSNEWVKFFLQFKSFAFSSTSRTLLAGLQQRDANALSGALLMMALGGMSYSIKQYLRGEEPNLDDPRVFLSEAFDQSGLAGWYMEPHNAIAKMTRGRLSMSGEPLSRYASRGMVASVIGPSAGLIQDMASITGDISTNEFDRNTVRAMRRIMPYQNIFYMRNLLNRLEGATSDTFGVPD